MISDKIVDVLMDHVPIQSNVLEIGTGAGTEELARAFKVYSVEDNSKWWIGKSKLIEVPLVEIENPPKNVVKRFPTFNEWYDAEILEEKLKSIDYEAIIVDGPRTPHRRPGFWMYRSLFNLNVPIIFDDVNRSIDWQIARNIAVAIKASKFEIYDMDKSKQFALVLP